jgi:hypothetical protein
MDCVFVGSTIPLNIQLYVNGATPVPVAVRVGGMPKIGELIVIEAEHAFEETESIILAIEVQPRASVIVTEYAPA